MKRNSKALDPPGKTILVGTYRKDQLEKWVLPQGFYNYPIHDGDTAIRAAAAAKSFFLDREGQKMTLPVKFQPSQSLLEKHRELLAG